MRDEAAKSDKALAAAREGDRTHTEVQGWLRDLGRALGFDVWVARNDVGRPYAGGRLSDGCLSALPAAIDNAPGAEAVRLIDVLWLERGSGRVADLRVRFLPYGELERHRDAMARFGQGMRPIEALARVLS